MMMGMISSDGRRFNNTYGNLFTFISVYLLSYFILVLTDESQQYLMLLMGSLTITLIISGLKLYYSIIKHLLATHNHNGELHFRDSRWKNINQQLSV